jgi:glycerol-3-phosphate dehydrogenase
MFPEIDLKIDDIQSSWAGLRPLIHEEGKSASELSRKDEIFISESGLISIAGGKLTGYRKMAERVVGRVVRKLEEDTDVNIPDSATEIIRLCGGNFKNYKQVKKYMAAIYQRISADGFSEYDAWYLVTTYGKQTETIIDIYNSLEGSNNAGRMIRAELHFGTRYEMVQTPLDFFTRRTGRLYFDIDSVRTHMDTVVEELREIMQADSAQVASWKASIVKALDEHSTFTDDRA